MDEKKREQGETVVKRRDFLNRFWLFLAGIGLFEYMWLAFSYLGSKKSPTVASASENWTVAGKVEDFKPGSVTAFPKGGFYISRLSDGGFLAVSRQCTHLGCTVPWVEEEKKFACPCHASAFDIKGDVLESPAQRALDLFEIRIENNEIRIRADLRIKRSRFEPEQAAYPAAEKA